MTTEEMKKGIVETIFSIPELTILDWQELFRKHPKGGNVAASTVSGWKNGKQSMRIFYRNTFIRILCDTPAIQEYWKDIQVAVVEYLGVSKKFRIYHELMEMEFEDFIRFALNELNIEKAVSIYLVGEVVSATNVQELFGKKLEELRGQFDFDKERCSDKVIVNYHFESGDYKVAAGFFFGEIPEDIMEMRCKNLYENSEGSDARIVFLMLDAAENVRARMEEEYGIRFIKISGSDRPDDVSAADALADAALEKMKEVLEAVRMCGKNEK